MRKAIFIAAFMFALTMGAPGAQALSCVPLDMYLDKVLEGEVDTFVFVGTATKVTEDHTQVVTVTEALQGYVAPELWVKHHYDDTWQYFCSNGPADAGESTVFFMMIDEYGSFTVLQTLDADSKEAKAFVAELKDKDVDAGITEAKPQDREAEVLSSIQNFFAAFANLLKEFRYWQGR